MPKKKRTWVYWRRQNSVSKLTEHIYLIKQLRNLISYVEPDILSTIQENDEHFI